MPRLGRRNFLLVGISLMLAPVVNSRAANNNNPVRVSDFKIKVPRLLFFPECKRQGPKYCKVQHIYLETLQFKREEDQLIVQFANGRKLEFDANKSFASSTGTMRERVVLKSLAAWIIDAARRIAPSISKRSLEPLQIQSVLEAVTPGSLYNLVEQLQQHKSIFGKPTSSIAWDASRSRFVLR